MTASISDRTIEALTAIATGLHDIADAVREFPGCVEGAEGGETPNNSECPCAACDPGMVLDGFASRMSGCPDCGNKRCPKAADHAKWECSGSNEVGQVGVPVEVDDGWPFKPGNVVHSNGPTTDAEWLDDAPQRTVLVDSQGTEWRRLGDGWFMDPMLSAARWASANLEQTYGPLSVISVGKDAP